MSDLRVYMQPLKTNMFGEPIVSQSDYLKSEVDAAIKKLNRALWLARARSAYLEFRLFVKDSVHTADSTEADNAERMAMKWHNVEHKCRAKAEEYR